ncbi:DUF1036 domain-containing protein [Mesorhizobium sp. CO1-1-4]|uniref:DUF1036 domain-containing protein n=1 Tax=Mesorhizobium sp. CO1-1-4 TaxID=2876633 RepID=UPI001CCA95D6|nr:DUF1036 domain-containing protein [Mesorhizobium sp. CO1-1-4]MBZ9740613.1 DUF1036 domain-containing protein [Mesorhizobium sp. CO1-1-4]
MILSNLGACLFALLVSSSASAASFPCDKAKHADEIAICADGELSARDVVLDRAFRDAKSLAPSPQARKNINTTTHKFNDERGLCGRDVWCIKDVQERTLGYFQNLGASENFLGWGAVTGSVDLDAPLGNEKLRINDETVSLRFCNKARQPVVVATSFRQDLGSDQFKLKGWYPLAEDGCSAVFTVPKGDFLWAALGTHPLAMWGDGPRLCVSDPNFDKVYQPGQHCRNGFTLKFFHRFIVRDTMTIDILER